MQKLELAAQTLVRSASGRRDAHAASVNFFLYFRYNYVELCGQPLLSLKAVINRRCHLMPRSCLNAPLGFSHSDLRHPGDGLCRSAHYRRTPSAVPSFAGELYSVENCKAGFYASLHFILSYTFPCPRHAQVFFDLAQVDVAPRDEVTVLKQQVDQTRALANSPDALPHNTVRLVFFFLKPLFFPT